MNNSNKKKPSKEKLTLLIKYIKIFFFLFFFFSIPFIFGLVVVNIMMLICLPFDVCTSDLLTNPGHTNKLFFLTSRPMILLNINIAFIFTLFISVFECE